MFAIRVGTDGLGPRELAVLDADDGVVRRTFTTDGTFGRATFEGDESIDTVVTSSTRLRSCAATSTAASASSATQAAEVVTDDPASLTYPYQLTAN